MRAEQLDIPEVLLLRPNIYRDERGHFVETANIKELQALGVTSPFVQDNQVYSRQTGVLRGLHFQKPPHAQGKLVRALRGSIFDVAVDIRGGSPTYGKAVWATLTAEGMEQLWVPPGFAHAYQTLEPDTEVFYKVTDFYAPQSESGIIWNDPDLKIPWPIGAGKPILSAKDQALPRLRDIAAPF
ncbi:MAG: dTDP-4-dehydrorhamnose 3,5-epimerase [Caulobacterales bacterium]